MSLHIESSVSNFVSDDFVEDIELDPVEQEIQNKCYQLMIERSRTRFCPECSYYGRKVHNFCSGC